MLFMFMCVHEDVKKIPARPLLIGYGLAGMGLMLSRIDSGSAEVRLVFLLIDYGLAGMRLMASTSSFLPLRPPFLPLRPPFLVLTQEKEAKESQAPNRGRGSWPSTRLSSLPRKGPSGVPAKLAGYLNSTNKHLINSTSFTFRFSLPRWPDRGDRRLARFC